MAFRRSHARDSKPSVVNEFAMLQDLTERVREIGDDLEDDFVMGEFLDRYGIRVSQLGNIISSISPIADAAPAADGPTAS